MTGVVIIAFIWGILLVSSGDDFWLGVWILFCLTLSAGVGLWIGFSEEKRKKDGERCMRNWEEYKRKNNKK